MPPWAWDKAHHQLHTHHGKYQDRRVHRGASSQRHRARTVPSRFRLREEQREERQEEEAFPCSNRSRSGRLSPSAGGSRRSCHPPHHLTERRLAAAPLLSASLGASHQLLCQHSEPHPVKRSPSAEHSRAKRSRAEQNRVE